MSYSSVREQVYLWSRPMVLIVFAHASCASAPARHFAAVKTEIAVRVDGRGYIPESAIWGAQIWTSSIFKPLGIKVIWNDERRPGAPGYPQVIAVTVVPFAPVGKSPEALASASLSKATITIFNDRVASAMQSSTKFAPALLSHVLAHEIAHVLQAVSRHSESGILKACWSREDFLLMQQHRLNFTPLDVELIRVGIGALAADQAAVE